MRGFDRNTFDPQVMGGRACIRGMRVTVSLILSLRANGMTPEEIVEAYPYLGRAIRREPPLDYPGNFELRWAQSKGTIKRKGQRLYVSETVRGEILGLEEIDDGLWSIYLGPLLLGRSDERDRNLELL